MHTFFALIVASLAIAAHGSPTSRIVGGSDAPAGKYPYQVSLRTLNRHFCGGSIINERTILTAAHCIIDKAEPDTLQKLTVHAGTNRLNESGTVYTAKRAIYHDGFDPYLMANDIGVLILSSNIKYTKLIQPVPLSTNDVIPDKYPCVLTGWGRLSWGGEVPNNLQELELFVYSNELCEISHWRVKPSHICTYKKKGAGACNGDSGGPLTANGTQIGITSFGDPCAVGYPDVYTRVSYFQQWLQENIENVKS